MTEITVKEKKEVKIRVFLTLLFSLVTYAVFFSTLVLFITNGLKLDDVVASNITAAFFALHFSLQIVGGFFTGRFFQHRVLFFIGIMLQATGCFILSSYHLYWGLAFFLSGTGFNLVCINSLLTQYFKPSDKTRESAFLYSYTAMNLGALIGATISGFFEITKNYHYLFIFAALSNVLTIAPILFRWKLFKDIKTDYTQLNSKKRKLFFIFGIFLISLLVLVLRWIIQNANYLNIIILIVGIIILLTILFIILKEKNSKLQKKLFAFIVFLLSSMIFWTLSLMAPLGLVLFIENNVNRSILNFTIPPQWFFNITSFTLVLSGPISVKFFKYLRQKGFEITIAKQFMSSLFFTSLAFIILFISILLADPSGYVNLPFVVLCYVFLGIGELLVAPIGYAMIGQIIPKKFHGITMGIWFLFIGVGAVLANIFSKWAIGVTISTNPLDTNHHFLISFISLAILALIVGVILLLLSKKLNRITEDDLYE